MYQLVYVQINLFCIVILLGIHYKIVKNVNQQIDIMYFKRVVLSTLLILVLDILWSYTEGRESQFYRVFNSIINATYMTDTAVISYCWMMFVESKIQKNFNTNNLFYKLLVLPVIILAVLCFSSSWTKLIFFIDENNIYQRGNFYFIQLIIAYLYLVVSFIRVLISRRKDSSVKGRYEKNTLLVFYLLPSIGGIIQAFLYGLPLSWTMTTISLLFVYIGLQDYKISTDELTQLDNRRAFDRYLQNAVLEGENKGNLYLLLMDINDFKSINDTFGHLEGDNALKETSTILQTVANKKDIFFARYGGDEFAAIYRTPNSGGAVQLKKNINQLFAIRNEQKKEYSLSLSIGYAKYEPGYVDTTEKMIKEADSALYKEKKITNSIKKGKNRNEQKALR